MHDQYTIRWCRHCYEQFHSLVRQARAVVFCSYACRFWDKVCFGQPDACWEWAGARKGSQGYGEFGVNRMPATAHRVAWELTHGPIPDGLFVLHRCDNPPCCNPAHLFLGTHQDNMADRDAKGRVAHGDAHYTRRRLTARSD